MPIDVDVDVDVDVDIFQSRCTILKFSLSVIKHSFAYAQAPG